MFLAFKRVLQLCFLLKKEKKVGDCKIEYAVMEDNWRKEEKLDWLTNS